jgi:hypothetical protein
MWRAECQQCHWVSRDCITKAAADVLANLHEQENAEHKTETKPLSVKL